MKFKPLHDRLLLKNSAGLIIEGLVYELLGSLLRERTARSRPAWIDDIAAFADSDVPSSLTLLDAARHVNRHPSRVAREFRRHFGMSVGDYARRRRLEHAATRLRDTDESIAVIAMNYGFADQSHFTRAFRAFFGAPPQHYRRQFRT